MKKIININLSGRVIPIEDSAYEKLQAYIESLRRYFSHEDGRDEIINDIESRIAELMSEKVRKGATSVTDADVDEIIASMGRPEELDAAEADADQKANASKGGTQQEYTTYTKPRRGRLYRDTSDKFIAGVCSGIANYLNTDPAIIRILFAIITFGGFGLGFLVYLILWMVLPTRDLDGYSGKRLFRNPDDRVLGGVAGGLSAYFDMKASTVRLIFAAPILLSILLSVIDGLSWRHDFDFFPNIIFGSLSGTFILAYVVLWIVLPEARSPYEKMEMRGEKVDVNSIRQNVREGMDNVKDRVKNWSDEAKEAAHNMGNRAKDFANTRGKAFATEVGESSRTIGTGIGHAIGVLFKVFFLFIAGTIAFAMFVALIALLFGGIAWWPINNFLWTSKWQQAYAWGTVIFFLAVPLISFITWVIRRVMRVRSRSSYLGWTFGFLWTIGWVSMILFVSSVMRDFRSSGYTDTAIAVSQPTQGRMIVAVTEPELEYSGTFGWLNDGGTGWDLTPDTFRLSTVRFKIEKSIDSEFHVTMRKNSNGSSIQDARERASQISYMINSRDSILDLGNGYAINKNSKFRGQQVDIQIQVPVGKKIRFDRSVDDKLNPTNFQLRRGYRRNRVVSIEWDNANWSRVPGEVDYTMTADGNLIDDRGNKVDLDDDYRYDHNNNNNSIINDTNILKQQKEDEKRKIRESEERIKELEKKEKESKIPTTTGNAESIDEKGDDVASIGSPTVVSVIKWF